MQTRKKTEMKGETNTTSAHHMHIKDGQAGVAAGLPSVGREAPISPAGERQGSVAHEKAGSRAAAVLPLIIIIIITIESFFFHHHRSTLLKRTCIKHQCLELQNNQ